MTNKHDNIYLTTLLMKEMQMERRIGALFTCPISRVSV